MKKNIFALLSGLIFGAGLVVSGMTKPHKVVGFLDLFGQFDISLMFVMVGAILVYFFGFRIAKGRDKPFLGGSFQLPTKNDLDKNLIIGAALFGIGWGLAGLCPGPALVSLATLNLDIIYFVIFMVIGMKISDLIKSRKV